MGATPSTTITKTSSDAVEISVQHSTSSPLSGTLTERNTPAEVHHHADDEEDDFSEKHKWRSEPSRISIAQGHQAFMSVLRSWFSRKFAVGCAILFPIVFTVWFCWWFLAFFDAFFSPIYERLFNFHVFGLGFLTSMGFIFCTGLFFSSWVGTALLGIGEWFVKRLPLVKHIYSASKQVSAALNPENEASKAFQECVLIRHPRVGEYAFAFITGKTTLQIPGNADTVLYTVYVPTNHVYVGDILLLEEKDIIRTALTVREGLEVVVSVGMAVPSTLEALPPRR